MKKTLSIAFLFLLFSLQWVSAAVPVESPTIYGVKYCLYDDNTATIIEMQLNLGSSGVYDVQRTITWDKKTYTVTSIGAYASSGLSPSNDANKTLRVLNIPNTVKSIGICAFSGCTNLVEVNFEDNMALTSIGELAFKETNINAFEFEKCPQLAMIGVQSFLNCRKLEKVFIPAAVDSLGYQAFYGCSNLSQVVFERGSKVKRIGSRTFSAANGTNLSKVELAEGLEFIGPLAFARSPYLKSFTIPSTVKNIAGMLFAGTPHDDLRELICLAPTPPTVTSVMDGGLFYNDVIPDNLTFKAPAGSLNAYRSAPYWKDFTDMGSTVTATDISFEKEMLTPDIDPYSSVLYFFMKGGPGILEAKFSPADVSSKYLTFTFEEQYKGGGSMTPVGDDKVRITPIVQNGTIAMSDLTVRANDGSGFVKKYLVYYTNPTANSYYKPELNYRNSSSGVHEWTKIDKEIVIHVGESVELKHGLSLGFPYVNMPAVTWNIDSDLARIDEKDSELQEATITGQKIGTGTLSVQMPADTKLNIEIPVRVIAAKPMTSLSLTPAQFTLALDAEPVKIEASYEPNDASDVDFEWAAVPEENVAIEPVEGEKGAVNIRPLKEGQVRLTANASDGSGLTAQSLITVKEVKLSALQPGEGLKQVGEITNPGLMTAEGAVMAPDNLIVMRAGQTASIVVFPAETVDYPAEIVCEPANSDIVELSYIGTPRRGVSFEGLDKGETTFTIKAGNESIGGTIKVLPKNPVLNLEVAPGEISVPLNCDVPEITVTTQPAELPEGTLTWSSSVTDVATVDPLTGEITLAATGDTQITVSTTDGTELSASFKLTVTDKIVKSITVQPSELTFTVGEEPTLTIVPDPADGVYEKIEFSLGDDAGDIITIEQNGSDQLSFSVKATWEAETDVIFTLTTSEGETKAICPVKAQIIPVESIILTSSVKNSTLEQPITIEATVLPENATLKELEWNCSPFVPKFEENGKITITPDIPGNFSVTATSKDGGEIEGRFDFNVYMLTVHGSFSNPALVGDEISMLAVLSPECKDADFEWQVIDNESLERIEIIGGMTEAELRCRGISNGDVSFIVEVKIPDGPLLRQNPTITLKYPTLTSIQMEESLELRQTRTAVLTPVANPEYAVLQGLNWSSDDEDVATVSADGTVTAHSPGQAVITATVPRSEITSEIDVKAYCTISVKPLYYNVTYYVDGGVYLTEECEYGTPINLPKQPSKEGHTFVAWIGVPPDLIMPDQDLEIVAIFEVNKYKLSFYIDEELLHEDYVYYNDPIEAPYYEIPEGHEFSGWDREIPETMPAEALEFHGNFVKLKYHVSFYIDGVLHYEDDVLYGDPVEVPDYDLPEGHEFSGWDCEIPETMPAEDLEFHGSFVKKTFHISFYIDGMLHHEADVLYGEAITVPEHEVPEGHEFSGWDREIPETMPAEDLEFHGNFVKLNFHVSFYIDGALHYEADVLYGEPIYVPEHEVPEGHEFSGWDLDIPETMPAEDLEFHGNFVKLNFHVSFYIDGALHYEADVLYGESIYVPEVSVPEGYEFSGWDRDIPETMPAENLEFHGRMEIKISGLGTVWGDNDRVDVYDLRGVRILADVDKSTLKERLSAGGIYILVERATGRRIKFAVR